MAEVAGAAYLVGEAVETTAQLGVAAYFVSQPTVPLKATFTQIATSSDDSTRLSLSRSGHSLSVVGDKAYIFGGSTAAGKLATNDVHCVTLVSTDKPESDYSVIPAVPDVTGGKVPAARTKHAACAFNICVAVYGGVGEDGAVIEEGSAIWAFVTAKSAWEIIEGSESSTGPGPRQDAKLFNDRNNLVLYGGRGANGEVLKDVWYFSYAGKAWTKLSEAPLASQDAAVVNGVLHLITSNDNLSSNLHILQLHPSKGHEHPEWQTVPFPTNALTPGPRPRAGGGLLPVSTGHGRLFLVYCFGSHLTPGKDEDPTASDSKGERSQESQPLYWSDMWTYQLPSASPEAKLTTSISDAIKPSKIKDSIRSALGYDTGQHSWAEIEVQPPTDMAESGGKVHPGPRGYFASDVMQDGRSIVIWGGINAKGETEGDGWIIKLE